MVRIRTVLQGLTYGCVVLAVGVVAEHLENFHLLGFLGLSLLALACEQRRVVEIPRWLLNGSSLGILVLAGFRITPEVLIEPILDALVILVAIKLLEDKKSRDLLQIYLLCLFLLVGSTLISLSISFLVTLSLLLMLVTAALILLAYFAHNPEMVISKATLGKVLLQALLMFSLSLPMSVLLFLILPRTAYPFLTFLNKTGGAQSGFTDTISLGQMAAIQEDHAVIFRAEMERVDESGLFWRGVVLDEFDGLRWQNTPAAAREELVGPDRVLGHTIEQTVYLEPYGNRYLFALDKPMTFAVHRNKHSRTRITPFKTKIFERIRYRATSLMAASFPQPGVDRAHYLALPHGFAPRVRTLVQSLVGQKPPNERLQMLFSFLRRGAYAYSLEDLPVSEAPLEAFLFVTKRGNCEYFASSLAVMLRMAGIPARLVGGYKGGHYNPTGKYYLVSQRNAHVWVEAYLPALGWLRLDPTPAAAAVASHPLGRQVFLQLRLLLDTFNYYWHKVIIDYDFTRQVQMVNAIRERISRPDLRFTPDLATVRNISVGTGLFLACSLLLWALFAAGRQRREERLLAGFLRRMAAHGYTKFPHEGLEEFLERIDREDLRARARPFVEDFQQVYYRDREFTRKTIQGLRVRLKGL